MITKSIFDLPFLTQTNSLLKGLSAYWKMDEAGGTRNDSSLNGLNLSDHNSNLLAGAGIIGNSVICSQSVASNGLVHASNTAFNTGPGISVSFSCWIRGNGLIVGNGILSYANSATNQAYTLYVDGSSNVRWGGTEAGTLSFKQLTVVTSAALGTTSFHHFAFGYDDVNKIIWCQYDNGARQTLAMNGMLAVTTIPFVVGNFSDLGFPQQVAVDELGFWNRVLTTSEVSRLYKGGLGSTYPTF